MFLFAILSLIVLICTIVVVVAVGIGGSAFVLIFGDVIVCIVLIIWILKRRINK